MIKTLQMGMGWFPEQAGGLNRYYYDCVQQLPHVGIDIQGLVAGSEKTFQTSDGRVQAFGVKEASLLKRWQQARYAVQQKLNQHDFQLVVSHFSLYTFPVLDLIKNYPLVIHFHGPWALEGQVEQNHSAATWFKKALETITYRRGVRFIVLSKSFQSVLHQTYGIPLEQIHVVPGGVNTDRFHSQISRHQAREILGWPQDKFILFAARRLAHRMGLENLVQAMSQVTRSHTDTHLFIAGKGELASQLQTQIETLSLSDHVTLMGYVSDENLALAYRAADVSIVPTVALEGFGLIVVESLASGTPVLGTPVGGIPEILEPFAPQLVLDGSFAVDIAQGITDVVTGKRKLPTADECLAYTHAHFSWHQVSNQILSVYKEAIGTSVCR